MRLGRGWQRCVIKDREPERDKAKGKLISGPPAVIRNNGLALKHNQYQDEGFSFARHLHSSIHRAVHWFIHPSIYSATNL